MGQSNVYLIDGSGYIFRAYYGIRPLSTRDGTPTHAVVGFARMLGKLLREHDPKHLCIAFDTKAPTFRKKRYADYKANRDAPPEDLIPQFALIHELVDAMGILKIAIEGYEADDIIATLAHQAVREGHHATVVSADKDLMQLVAPKISMWDPMKAKAYNHDEVVQRFGVPPDRVVDHQGLTGDSSDNIPGVPKVGPKTASLWLQTYGDIEDVITAISAKTKRKAAEQSLVDNIDKARLSKELATLLTTVPLSQVTCIDDLAKAQPKRAELAAFLEKIEAQTLKRDLGLLEVEKDGYFDPRKGPRIAQNKAQNKDLSNDSKKSTQALGQTAAQTKPIDRDAYTLILKPSELEAFIAKVRAAKILAIDLETDSLQPSQAQIVGFAMAIADHPPVYVPVAHQYPDVPQQISRNDAIAMLKPVLEDKNIAKTGHNLKYDIIVLHHAGVRFLGLAHDTMLAAYALDPSRNAYGLDPLAKEMLSHTTILFSDVAGKGKKQISFDAVALEAACTYAAEDADISLRLHDILVPQVLAGPTASIYQDLDLPMVPVLARMETAGVLVDKAHLEDLAQEFSNRLDAIQNEAETSIGRSINLASPKQLSQLFFEELGYTPVKKTKTGFSTDQEVLETLAAKHALPGIVLQHRLLSKLKSTYVDSLPKMLHPSTDRVHSSFHATGTATGRLSSSDPNLQNIPIRSEDGRRIRRAFVAPQGSIIVSADYSQIELRMLAHLSEDPLFIAAFVQGDDIHQRTADEIILAEEPEMDRREARRRAKAINFGIIYGLSQFGLARQLGISRNAAGDFIKKYFARYPGIRTYLDTVVEHARSNGYVSTLAGRRRYLPNLNSQNRPLRQATERIAMNTPLQGSAADLIKMAMLRVDAQLIARKMRTKLILQVHDELLLEAPLDEADDAVNLLKEEMISVMSLRVPLTVDVGRGQNWAEAHGS